jgi:hypothetical protein
MADDTPRLSLPMLAAGQAQKELTHNEALVLIDALIGARVEAANAAAPPAGPIAGQCWAVGASPTGAWAGQAGALAIATVGGWRFCNVPDGFAVRLNTNGALWLRQGSNWGAPTGVAAPVGGTIVDSEARASISALRTALINHGLIVTL